MDALRNPIPGDAPAGIYLKEDKTIYRGLRNAFNAAQSAYRSYSETPDSLNDRGLETTNQDAWNALAETAQETLTDRSKDLEILCWFVGAQIHLRNGVERTRDAMAVMADLVDAGIEALQPIPPESKLKGSSEGERNAEIAELKLRPFVQLFGEVDGGGLLYGALTNCRIVGDVTYGRFLAADRAGDLDGLKTEVAGELPAATSTLTARIEALQQLIAVIARLDKALRVYAGANRHNPPVTAYLTRHITTVIEAMRRLTDGTGFDFPGAAAQAEAEAAAQADSAHEDSAGTAGGDANDGAASSGGTAKGKGRSGGGVMVPGGVPGNRDDALAQLAALARHFRETEPHSPVHLLLDRAVRWGKMSAGDLFRELLNDGSQAMAQVTLMTGLESAGFSNNIRAVAAPVVMPTLDSIPAAPMIAAPSAVSAPAAPAAQPPTAAAPEQPATEQPVKPAAVASFSF